MCIRDRFKFIPALEQKFKKSAKTEIVNEKPTAALKTEMRCV